jgi:hypothetical protein
MRNVNDVLRGAPGWRFSRNEVIISKQVLSNTLSAHFRCVIRIIITSPEAAASGLPKSVSRCGWWIPGVFADVV